MEVTVACRIVEGTGSGFRRNDGAELERFQQKWTHFCGSEARQNKDLEPMF
jgi:hypothetical protein